MKRAVGQRLSRLRRVMRHRRLDSMIISNPLNVRYFSGFTGEDSYLLVGTGWAHLVTDGRFTEQAKRDCPWLPALTRDGRMTDAVKQILTPRKARKIGVEGHHLVVAMRNAMEKALHKTLKPLGPEVDLQREVKDEGELATILKAVRVAEKAFSQLIARGCAWMVGKTERQVAAELEYSMRLLGAERPAFETIVAAGENAALPHYRPRERKIRRDEEVLFDWGAVVDGYCSDLTRVVFTGRIPPHVADIYQTVLRAQEAGIKAVAAGATGEEVDAAARNLIAADGHGPAFSHGLGHGFGLHVHEGPRLGRGVKQPLRVGMVVTIEPGIYLPGQAGVRIEDDVLVMEGTCKRLSRLPRDMESMTLR
jgi:Xaa-Pro aminopeptidase